MARPSLTVWLIAATIVMAAAFAVSFRWLGMAGKSDADSTLGGDIVLQDVELRGRDASSPSWQVRADSVTLARDRRAGAIVGMHDGVFYDHRQPVVSFTADRLTYQDAALGAGGVLEMTGNIDVHAHALLNAAAPIDVQTSIVRWRLGDHRLICPQPVRATVGALGSLTTRSLMLDTQTHSLEAGPILAVADAGIAPMPPTMATPLPQAPKPSKGANTVTVSAPEGGRWDESTQTLYLTGPVTFKQGEAQMTTTGAVYNRRTKTAHSESPVTITDETSTVTGDHGTIDFGAHTATLADHIHMTVLPKPVAAGQSDPDAAVRKPTTLTCRQIVYDYRSKQAHTTGEVVITQKDQRVTADSGLYDVKTQIANLNGNVVATSTDGKVFRAPTAKIFTEPGKESVEVNGPINGIFPDTDDADTPAPAAAKAPSKSQPKTPKL